jgi:hypothetical protein
MAQDRAPWPIKPGSQIWPLVSRFALVRDLLLCAKHLFIDAKTIWQRSVTRLFSANMQQKSNDER